MKKALQLLAGPAAMSRLNERGLRPEDVDVVVGASGGPKWLALTGLDRALFPWLQNAPRERPLHLVGSSIGSWRMACLAQRDPLAAIARFEDAYIHQQKYSRQPTPAEVSRVSEKLLDALLGSDGAQEILDNTDAHLHVITVRARGFAKRETRRVQLAALALAALANVIHRNTLRWQFQRVIFDTAGDTSPFRALADFPTQHLSLTRENLRAALIASGSIPLVLEGVRIPGAPAGVYRDGGIIDYHPDFDFGAGEGLVLYPHFYPHVVPGWFDKSLRWRKANAKNFERVLLLAPTQEFVAGLPGGRIPDRKDFYRYDEAQRIRAWESACEASRRLGDELNELLASGRWTDRVTPIA
ncbi:MAG TPA: patatin-like phospholipase family protein [Gammaproteobacteria bacterium]